MPNVAQDLAAAVGGLLTGQAWLDPYPAYDAIRAHGELVEVDDGFFVAVGFAVADAVLREPRLLVSDRELASLTAGFDDEGGSFDAQDRVIGASMLRANPPDHTRMRRLAAGTFTPRRLESMRETVTDQATTLVRYLAHLAKRGETFDFVSEFGYPLPIRVICALLGVPARDQHWFREQATALTAVLEPALSAQDVREAVDARGRLDLYFTDLIARRRAEPGDDLVTAFALARDEDGTSLPTDELLSNLVLLLVAGFETTTNLLGNGLAVLLGRPDLSQALRDDPSLAPSFVEEVLRFDSPVQVTSRWCKDEVPVAGVNLPPYSQVLVLLGGANRDPLRYPDPGVFDPSREGRPPLSFGAGGHYCLGAALARMEAQIAFPLLVRELPRLALAAPPLRRNRLTLRGYAELPLVG